MLIWRLLQRLILGRLKVRYGDVRALKEMYHLRSVLIFVSVFAATVAFPALLLAWYGFQGIRAEQRAGTAEVERVGELAAAAAVNETERYFFSFEDAVLNRLKSGESLHTSIGELSDALRVVYRFGSDGELRSPFRTPDVEIEPDEDQILFSSPGAMDAWRTGARDAAASIPLYVRARRQARGDRADAALLIHHAHMLLQTGNNEAADADYLEALQRYGDLRDGYGFRIGDIARLKRGEILIGQDPVGAQAQLQGLVEELMAIDWVIGRGGEAAITRRVLDLLAPRSDPDWLARMRSRIAERSAQHCVAGQLQEELDSLGAKGRLLKVSAGQFSYIRTENALWAITWTEADQYVMALDLSVVLSRLAWQSARIGGGPDSEVRVEVVGPEEEFSALVVARRSLAPWLSGWSVQVWPRDPAALATRQQEQWRRGVFIVGVSVVMIGLGALLSAWLLQRELDGAREKADFAARVSHELRSPITQIRLKAEALLLGLATSETARNRHYEIIMRESERLSRLVDNMLDFAAIERGIKKYSMRPGDLNATVIRAVESAQVAMEMAGIEIGLELPEDLPAVKHDPDAVSQAIANLLSNAAKYGSPVKKAAEQASGSAPGNTIGKPQEPADGVTAWIGVSVQVVDTDKIREVWVEVSDRGIGIAPEEQSKIFEQYYRSSDPRARRRKGTGLGLTIVRYILEAHNGRVSVRSIPGQGSTFILQFPTDL